jgi:splicing factor U2AF 35 kDa subunit
LLLLLLLLRFGLILDDQRVNCPFYFKIGACRHGDRCSRVHNKPILSQTLIIPNMYQSLALQMAGVSEVTEPEVQQHFDDFYEDVYEELSNFGELEELHVCDNLGDHLIGNVYAQYTDELECKKAVESLNGRFYAGM